MAIKQPEDQSYFILPDLGEGVHEAELIKWRVKPGDHVDEHETIAEMETDKALVEVPSPWAGVIKALHGNEGDILLVGSKVVDYETDDKLHHETDGVGSGARQAQHAEPRGGEREDAGTVVGNMDSAFTVSERFKRKEEAEAAKAAERGGKPLATPAVRRLAREMGVDLKLVNGTGRGGRITASDVRAASGQGEQVLRKGDERMPTPVSQPPAGAGRGPGEPSVEPAPIAISEDGVAQRIPFRGVRRKIAEALHRSVQTTVHFTAVDEADVTALDKKRREYGSLLGRKLSLLPFVMAAVCKGLRQHPTLNANVDDANGEILVKNVINLGCAVDTEHGLMVPVIRNADNYGLVQLGDAVGDLAKQCRDRSVPREQLTGGTFTVSNVGSYGGMFATPIINYPEVSILAVGRAKEQVMTRNGAFYAGISLPLSISCDHRVVDGAEAVRFLNTVVKLLEAPETLVKGL